MTGTATLSEIEKATVIETATLSESATLSETATAIETATVIGTVAPPTATATGGRDEAPRVVGHPRP